MTVGKILVSEREIAERLKELGKTITEDYQDREPVFVGVLNGCYMFFADLTRLISIPITLDFVTLSSYRNGIESSGEVKLVKDLEQSIGGRDIIIVDDILDTGRTLKFLKEVLQERNPASIRVAVLLEKSGKREADIEVDYVGFSSLPDEYVVGYGLDYAGLYRNLPYIAILEKRS